MMTHDKDLVTIIRTAISYWKDFYSEGARGHQKVVSRAGARPGLRFNRIPLTAEL